MEKQIASRRKKILPRPGKGVSQYPVPVARVLLFNEAGQLLILKRHGGAYCPGQWCLPGGKIDYGDTPEKAAAREVWEETGLRLLHTEFLGFQNNPPMAKGLMHCINLYFRGNARGKLSLNEESSEYAWVTPKEALRKHLVFGGGKMVKQLMTEGRL